MNELKKEIDYWAYILKNSQNMQEIPQRFPESVKNALR